MDKKRNDFLETLRFDISGAFEEYGKYLYTYKKPFIAQALAVHSAIMEDFPEIDFGTICRIKSLESTMDKVKHKGLDKVYDIHGMKHIIYSVRDCTDEKLLTEYCYKLQKYLADYYAKKGIQIVDSKTKDYIAHPKENGYMALHMSGKKDERKFETQIKTSNMEKNAKYGEASHAEKYKPRDIGKYPLLRLPRYFTITNQNGAPVFNELSVEDCFQYFYNVPYDNYYEKVKEDI